ncbi:MAG: hypothetical protein Q4P12_04635 [Bacteroidales bacterium]|nr:hypothetical protein [Bacteroidales bacterium]
MNAYGKIKTERLKMPDNNQTNTSLTNDVQPPKIPTTDPVNPATKATPADKETPVDVEEIIKKSKADALALMPEIASKINEAHNILIALSSDPSVDEIAAAIGLSLYLDRLGKRATAIYSGSTPNALEFLKPDETFDTTADTLQDFVIALNKEKADHLRYKLDGDYVKIFITPYRSRIAEEDLEFSYGDFNIDLVLALNVANGVDLDAALREHGRIMHDASIVNITTGNPGKFGEIGWSDKSSSSVSEMVARLIYNMGGKSKVQPEEATAFLTGIVAATDRFSKGNTYADTMRVASDLLESGADQQLIAKNITAGLDNQIFSLGDTPKALAKDPTALDVNHKDEADSDAPTEISIGTTASAVKEDAEPSEDASEEDSEESSLLDELKATAENIAATSVTTPDAKVEPVRLDAPVEPLTSPILGGDSSVAPVTPVETPAATEASVEAPSAPAVKPEMVIQPSADVLNGGTLGEGTSKYSDMLTAALGDAPAAAQAPIISPDSANPAASIAPSVPVTPEANGVPDLNFMPPDPNDRSFTPPTPPIDFESPYSTATTLPDPSDQPLPSAPTSLGPQPAMQDQVYNPQASFPDAFKIPGM